MGHDVRFLILSSDSDFAGSVRAMLLQEEGVKIVAEVDDPGMLMQALQQFPVDVLLANLDPSPEVLLPLLSEALASREHLVAFAASQSTDGPLILNAMRAGVKEFLPKPIDAKALKEAIGKVVVDRVGNAQQGKLITVVGTSGGVGATVITTNLAVELAALATGEVAVVDLDYRYGQVATLLDVDPNYTLADLCGSPEALDSQIIGRALTKHGSGVQVLCRPAQLTEAETITAAATMSVFSQLTQLNEYVIADGPMRFDINANSLLALSDLTLLVVQQSVPCVRNALRIIESMRDNGCNLERAKVVCNRLGRSANHLSVDDVTDTLGLPAFASIPDDWDTVSGAINLGEPLATFSPKSKVRIALQEIAERLYSPVSEADEKEACKQGLIGRIFAGG